MAISSFNKSAFYLVSVILTVACLVPIWAFRLLPMQDYPQHLFLSQVIATYGHPTFDWNSHYDLSLGIKPYMLWYLVMKTLALFVNVEVAGKIIFSLYILLIAALGSISLRGYSKDSLPWGGLLLYPFAFHQGYFMGFPNYIISLPILCIAILHLEEITQKPVNLRWMLLHALYLMILFLNHPYTVLVYIGLATVVSFFYFGKGKPFQSKAFAQTLIPSFILIVIFVIWFLILHRQSTSPNAGSWAISHWPIEGTIKYYLLMFTGMRWTPGPNWLAVLLWITIAMTFILSWLRNGKRTESLRWPLYSYFASLYSFIILPFWFGYYSYFNLRLAPVSYFALAIVLSRIRLGARAGIIIASCALFLIVISIDIQAKISSEAEDILPILSKMEKNSLVLPVVFESTSSALDPVFFYQIHANEVSYYHVVVGGGASPSLFPNAMMPVQYKSGFDLKFIKDPTEFLAQQHRSPLLDLTDSGGSPGFTDKMTAYFDLVSFSAQKYKYIVVRKAPQGMEQRLAPCYLLVAQTVYWKLFRNNSIE